MCVHGPLFATWMAGCVESVIGFVVIRIYTVSKPAVLSVARVSDRLPIIAAESPYLAYSVDNVQLSQLNLLESAVEPWKLFKRRFQRYHSNFEAALVQVRWT